MYLIFEANDENRDASSSQTIGEKDHSDNIATNYEFMSMEMSDKGVSHWKIVKLLSALAMCTGGEVDVHVEL